MTVFSVHQLHVEICVTEAMKTRYKYSNSIYKSSVCFSKVSTSYSEVTAIQISTTRKIDLYRKYWENTLQTLPSMVYHITVTSVNTKMYIMNLGID